MSLDPPAAVIVLAAGEGTRMRSATPKVLHEVCGRSLLAYVTSAARALSPQHLLVVIGHGRERVAAHLAEIDPAASAVVQERQDGTGAAVMVALRALRALGQQAAELEGTVLVVCGDTPLLTSETLGHLVAQHDAQGAACTLLSAALAQPRGYGRVLRDAAGAVLAIVEEQDADEDQRAITEVNAGVYAFDAGALRGALSRLSTSNAQGEQYLTDVVGILRADGHPVGALPVGDAKEILGVNDRVQLAAAGAVLRDRLLGGWMRAGATIIDPATTWLDAEVRLEPDCVVRPNTQLYGRTVVSRGAEVGPNCTLSDTTVGAGASVVNAVCQQADIGPGASIGPFAFLRPGTAVGEAARVGTYVETKNAVLGPGAKVPHLSYVGDAEIGAGSNIGAASVFVNYDGQDKHRTSVGEHVRVGSDTMLVAPLRIGDGAYTAAGSVITEDVPAGALAVARGIQRNIEGWVGRRRPGTSSARAAAAAGAAAPPEVPGPQEEQP